MRRLLNERPDHDVALHVVAVRPSTNLNPDTAA